MVDVERDVLRQRLVKRWLDLGLILLEANTKVNDNGSPSPSSSRSNSDAPLMAVSGDLSSWDPWAANERTYSVRSTNRPASVSKLCDNVATSRVP
jgi:hypothetical protein